MRVYYVRWYGKEAVVVRVEAKENLFDGTAKAFIHKDGGWVESPDHVNRVLYMSEYDKISKEEAERIIKRRW